MITADEGIACVAKKAGLDVLNITPGQVTLPGEQYGFLGGASGQLPDGTIVFLGDIRRHPDYAAINSFFSEHNMRYNYLSNLNLFDGGSVMFI